MALIDNIPQELKAIDRWVVWGDGNQRTLNKKPLMPDGRAASSTNPATWSSFGACCDALRGSPGRYNGLGFVFVGTDDYCGVDLDHCVDPLTREVALWAKWILDMFPGAYVELSPSRTGLKLFCRGMPESTGKFPAPLDGQVEVYSEGRYFTMTARQWRKTGVSEISDCSQGFLRLGNSLVSGDLFDIESCRAALWALPDAVSGEGGHNATLRAMCEIRRLGIVDEARTWLLADWFNRWKCRPSWDPKELKHKIESSRKFEPGIEFTKIQTEKGETDADRQFKVYTPAELEEMDLTVNFWINDLLIDSQPMVIGATSKSLKTSLALSAGVSLATGTPFLGRNVPVPKRVIVFSGESGLATIRGVIRRVSKFHGLSPAECQDRLLICDTVPSFESREHLTLLRDVLRKYEPDFAIIDPAYMALGGEGADNVFAMGVKFKRLMDVCRGLEKPVLPCIIHHAGKAAKKAKSLTLSDLAWAGWSEFAGQWWLIARQDEKFDGRTHELRLQAGSRAGTFADLSLTVDEGVADFGLDGRIWQEVVHEWATVQAESHEEADPDSDVRQRLVEYLLGLDGQWASGKQVRKVLGGSSPLSWRKFVALRDGNLSLNGIEYNPDEGFRFRPIEG